MGHPGSRQVHGIGRGPFGDGLLAAGRCISATHEGMAGARVMATCVAIGQAAGTAAALAVQDWVPPAAVDVAMLREGLRADGQLV